MSPEQSGPVRSTPHPSGPGAFRFLAGLVALLFCFAAPLAAQDTGRVTGEVTNLDTGEPLTGAQIVLEGTGLGALANNVGRFVLMNVPAGDYTLSVQRIGFATHTEAISVPAGETVVVDVGLRPKAVELEGVVVTGTAGQARRREIGNSVTQINAAQLENKAVTEFADILQGQAAGLSVMENSGAPGTGSSIRLRGNNSVTFGNQPLIYVDGVRISNSAYSQFDEANQGASPLDDLNPADVERVEVVKGAAATTLYGTEAAGGVIQIFTKRGAAGAPAWQFNVEQGFSQAPWIGPDEDVNPHGLYFHKCRNVDLDGDGTVDYNDPSCPEDGSWFKLGHLQRYNLSVRGGSETTDYFISGKFGRTNSVYDAPKCVPQAPDWDECVDWTDDEEPAYSQEASIRGNFGFNPTENLTIRLNNNYTWRNIKWIPDGNNAEGMGISVARGYAGYTTEEMDGLVYTMDLDTRFDHFTTGMNILWNPWEGVDQKLSLGMDYTRSRYMEERPWGFWYSQEGGREVDDISRRVMTVDYTGTWRTAIPFFQDQNFESVLSWGAQMYDNRRWGLNVNGETFAGPGDKLVTSGANLDVWGEYNRTLTSGGFFFQEQIGWQDKLFLTGGVRYDGFSTFGEGFDLAVYPKAQLSYLVSDEAFWQENLPWWDSMKLRGAVGQSGKAPGAFDAERVWEADPADEGQPGVIIANLGNPDLGPEVTTEYEGGFDASFLGDRLGVEFTYYYQKTKDGLIAVAEVPSNGVAENQLRNVGEFKNTGIELSANFEALRLDNFLWTVGGHLSTNNSEVLDLGGLEDIYIGWRNRVRPCMDEDDPSTPRDDTKDCPLPAFYQERVMNPDAVGEAPDMVFQYIGPTYPTHNYGINTSLTFFERFRLDALAEGAGGHYLSSGTAYQNVRRGEWPSCWEIQEKVDAGQTSDLTAYDLAKCTDQYTGYGMWAEPADWFKIRNVSLSYRVPQEWLPAQARSLTLRASGRNLWTFTDWPGMDPETYEDGSMDSLYRQEYYNLPPVRTFIFSASVGF